MASRLTEDQIKWILTLDASAAEKEINSLIKVNKQLQEANKGVQKEMRQLEAAGKKESDEYRNLNGVLRENNNTLKTNREQIKRLENQMGLANLSMSQLRRRAQDLESQMNRTSRNLHPEEWGKLQKELTETRSKMDELKKAGKQAEESLGTTIFNKGMWATLVGNMATKFAEFVGGVISGMKDLVAEGINMAAAADGVTRAFEALDRPGLLDNLRKATKGTVNDLELMKAANMAKDFRIPLEDLGKYLEFAQLKAQQTGQSVEYMTNSIVTGLGRKSVLILDNLGLSAAEINEQMAKTGDFMSAVASIVDKQLSEAGGSYISEADKMAQGTVRLQNAQMELGKTLLPLKQNLDETIGSFKMGMMETIGWIVKNRTAIGELVAVIGAYIAIKKTLIAVNTQSMAVSKKEMALQALEEVQVRASIAAEYALAAAKALLTGNIKAATVAMRSFLLTLGLNPITAITVAITAATYGIYKLCTRTNEAKEAMNSFTSEMLTEKRELDKLFNALKNAADKTKEKKNIIDAINKQYKDYLPNLLTEHSTLDEIKTAYDLINRKLKENIALKTLNEKTNEIESKSLENKTKEINNIRDELSSMPDFQREEVIDYIVKLSDKYVAEGKKVENAWTDVISNVLKKYYSKSSAPLGLSGEIQDYVQEVYDAAGKIQKVKKELSHFLPQEPAQLAGGDSGTGLQTEEKSLIQIQKELLELAQKMPETTEAEIAAKNRKIAAINKEIQRLQSLGTEQKKAAEALDSMSADISANDNAYKERLLSIKKNREAENLTDEEYNLQNLKAEREFLDEKLKILKEYYQKEKDSKKRRSIAGQISDTESKGIDVGNQTDRAEITNVKATWADRLAQEEEGYRQLKLQFTRQLADQKITKEQYDVAILALEEEELKTRLTLQKEYLNTVNNLELQNGQLKAQAVREAGNEVLKAEQLVEDKRAEQVMKMSSLLKDFKDQFNLTNQENETDTQLKFLESVYNARKSEAQNQGLDTTELDTAYEQAKTNIMLKGEQERANIRQQYGISSMQEEYRLQMDMLEQQHAQGLLNEKEYQQAKVQLQMQQAKGYFDTYSGLASSAVGAMQQAELDQIDAKYDVAIEAAQGNSEEVERLENEKAQKKLDVQKKYADVNFAIQISQIIANTAVAIMQAFAQLGPIGGAIATAFLTATGAAQIISAKAERDKVKNMTLNNASSSSGATGSRVVTGKESGGYIDVTREQDKKRYRASLEPGRRGYVDTPTVIVGDGPAGRSREWVASNDAVSNPTIRPLLDMIDSAQRSGTVRTVDMNLLMRQRMAGFQSGGFLQPQSLSGNSSQSKSKNDDTGLILPVLSETRDLLLHLKNNGVNAIYSLTELEKKQKLKASAEAPFTRKK